MSVPTKQNQDRTGAATIPPDGTRTYARLWPWQYLSGFVIAIATLDITIRADAFASFETGSALLLAVAFSLTFFAFTPMAIISGRLVDRWGPKRVLVGSNVGYVALMVISLVALAVNFFPAWLAIALLLGRTGSQSAQITALETSVPVLFSRRDLIRANGSRLILTASVAGFEAPLADALYPNGLFVVLAVTTLVLVASLVSAIRSDIPDTLRVPVGATDAGTGRRDYHPLRAHLRRRPGLVLVLASFALFNFVFGFSEVSDRHITEALGSEATTNLVLGVGFVFMIATTVAITLRGTPRGHVRWLRLSFLALGAAMVLGAARPNLVLVTAAVTLFLVSAPLIMTIVSTLLHANTEPHLIGRMMGVKTMIIGLFYGTGNITAVLFTTSTGSLAGGKQVDGGIVGGLVGTGDASGRVYAFLTLLLGLVVVALTLALGRHRSLLELEDANAGADTDVSASASVTEQTVSTTRPHSEVRDFGDLSAKPSAVR